MPKAQLDRRAAVSTWIEILRDGLPVAALGRCSQTEQHAGSNRLDEGIEAIRGQPVAFIDDHGMPLVGANGGDQIATGHAIDGGKQMVAAFGLVTAAQQFAELRVAQHFTVGTQRLAQDFLAMGDE